jgi:tRNA(fMet)-specific endonuclease VapC
LLDTNTVSLIIKNKTLRLQQALRITPRSFLSISSITEAELRYGLAKKPDASRLRLLVNEFLLRVNIASWDSAAAACYADLLARAEKKGVSLGAHDMLIAAHAKAINAILVTNEQAFFKLDPWLVVEDWSG